MCSFVKKRTKKGLKWHEIRKSLIHKIQSKENGLKTPWIFLHHFLSFLFANLHRLKIVTNFDVISQENMMIRVDFSNCPWVRIERLLECGIESNSKKGPKILAIICCENSWVWLKNLQTSRIYWASIIGPNLRF